MPEYRLDLGDGGLVSLPSGDWNWFPVRLLSLPGGVCETQFLVLAHAAEAGSVLRVRIPTELCVLDNPSVEAFAKEAEEREILTGRGRFLVRSPSEHDRDDWWKVSPEVGPTFRMDVHRGRVLAELTREEMLEIVDVAE